VFAQPNYLEEKHVDQQGVSFLEGKNCATATAGTDYPGDVRKLLHDDQDEPDPEAERKENHSMLRLMRDNLWLADVLNAPDRFE